MFEARLHDGNDDQLRDPLERIERERRRIRGSRSTPSARPGSPSRSGRRGCRARCRACGRARSGAGSARRSRGRRGGSPCPSSPGGSCTGFDAPAARRRRRAGRDPRRRAWHRPGIIDAAARSRIRRRFSSPRPVVCVPERPNAWSISALLSGWRCAGRGRPRAAAAARSQQRNADDERERRRRLPSHASSSTAPMTRGDDGLDELRVPVAPDETARRPAAASARRLAAGLASERAARSPSCGKAHVDHVDVLLRQARGRLALQRVDVGDEVAVRRFLHVSAQARRLAISAIRRRACASLSARGSVVTPCASTSTQFGARPRRSASCARLATISGTFFAARLALRVLDHVFALGREADAEGRRRQRGDAGEDVGIGGRTAAMAASPVVVLLDLAVARIGDPPVGDRRDRDEHDRPAERAARLRASPRALRHVDAPHAARRGKRGRARHQRRRRRPPRAPRAPARSPSCPTTDW